MNANQIILPHFCSLFSGQIGNDFHYIAITIALVSRTAKHISTTLSLYRCNLELTVKAAAYSNSEAPIILWKFSRALLHLTPSRGKPQCDLERSLNEQSSGWSRESWMVQQEVRAQFRSLDAENLALLRRQARDSPKSRPRKSSEEIKSSKSTDWQDRSFGRPCWRLESDSWLRSPSPLRMIASLAIKIWICSSRGHKRANKRTNSRYFSALSESFGKFSLILSQRRKISVWIGWRISELVVSHVQIRAHSTRKLSVCLGVTVTEREKIERSLRWNGSSYWILWNTLRM